MPATTIVLLAFAALGAGVVDAIAGGGGLITVPALLAAGLPPHIALGTNKGQSVWGSGAAMLAFWRAGRVDGRQARYAFPLGFLGSIVGATIVSGISKDALRPIIIGMLIGASVLLLVKKPSRDQDAPVPRWYVAALLALLIGAYDGFFGPGCGTFLIVGFVALCGRSLVHASADAKVVNFASNLAAVVVFSQRHTILWEISLPMALGQLTGGILGAHFAMRGGARVVKIFVLLVSGALIAKLIVDLIPSAHAAPPKPPHGIKHITIDYTHSGYMGPDRGYHYKLEWDPAGLYAGDKTQTLSTESVDALLASITDLRPAEHVLDCNAMADNNSTYSITLDGKPAIELMTRSSCENHTPWNVVMGGKRFFQISGAIDAQVQLLLQEVDPTHWPTPSQPPRHHGSVPFVVADASTDAAKACARDLETTTAFTGAKGVLMCDRDTSKDCSSLDFRATFMVSGVEVDMVMPCNAGHVALARDRLIGLLALIKSKLMRTIIAIMDKTPPRVTFSGRTWSIVRVPHATTLTYDPATRLVETLSNPTELWSALGVSAPATGAKVTLDGRLAK